MEEYIWKQEWRALYSNDNEIYPENILEFKNILKLSLNFPNIFWQLCNKLIA